MEILQALPMEEKSSLESYFNLDYFKKQFIKNVLAPQVLVDIIPLIREFGKNKRPEYIRLIQLDFNTNPDIVAKLKQHKIENEKLGVIVDTCPAQMQLLYRKMIHLQREERALLQLKQQLIPMPDSRAEEIKDSEYTVSIERNLLLKLINAANKKYSGSRENIFIPDQSLTTGALIERLVQHRNLLVIKHEQSTSKSFIRLWVSKNITTSLAVKLYDDVIRDFFTYQGKQNLLTEDCLKSHSGKLTFSF